MQPADPNHRPTVPLQPSPTADATRTFTDPSSTLPFQFGPPIVGPVDNWPAGLTRYKPLHLLGDGGMGEVYLAHDHQLDRQVAIKFARKATIDTTNRILAEARAAARLHHPNICPVFDADVCDGVPYLTMGFVQGPTLAAELARLGPCPPEYAAKLIRSVAEAMRYAHEHGVIHRDLKPGNILLTAEHEPVVTDFGLAVRLDREGLAHGVISGTPHYMAPEQAAGDAEKIGERTDVFALGIILFEMLTGRVPFDGNARTVLEQVKTKPVPPVRKVRKDVPERLARIVAKATTRDPANRYDGMGAFADALTDFLRTERPPKKRKFRWLFWLVAVPALLSLTFVLLSCCVGFLLPAIQKVREAANRVSSAKQIEERTAELTREGQEFAIQGKFKEALAKYDEALRLDPEAVTPRKLRGELYERMERFPEALSDYEVLVGQEPNNDEFRRNRAAVLMKEDLAEVAIVELDFAARLRPNHPATYILRAEAYIAQEKYERALADLNRAVELDERNARTFRLRKTVKEKLGDETGAIADDLRAFTLEGETRGDIPPGPSAPPAPPPPKK